MSNWTHVAGIIRMNSFRFDELYNEDYFDKLIGKECLFDAPLNVWDDAEENPDDYLPMGSEGSLQKSVWIDPDPSNIAAYTISIFGDLRNHDDIDEIIDWFKKICSKIWVRQAIITVLNERNGEKNWLYTEDWLYTEEDKEDKNE